MSVCLSVGLLVKKIKKCYYVSFWSKNEVLIKRTLQIHINKHWSENEDEDIVLVLRTRTRMKKKVRTTRIDLKDADRGLTISFLLGGSSILILNLASRSVSP